MQILNKNVSFKKVLIIHFVVLAIGIIVFLYKMSAVSCGGGPTGGLFCGIDVFGGMIIFCGLWLISLFLTTLFHMLSKPSQTINQKSIENSKSLQLNKWYKTSLLVSAFFIVIQIFPAPQILIFSLIKFPLDFFITLSGSFLAIVVFFWTLKLKKELGPIYTLLIVIGAIFLFFQTLLF